MEFGEVEPIAVGLVAEQDLSSEHRRRWGIHCTPPALARRLAGLVAGDERRILDPACGGGALLIAALDALVARGCGPADALSRVAGIEIDPHMVAAAHEAIGRWAHQHRVPAPAGIIVEGDGLLLDWDGPVDLVLANPPFGGQVRGPSRRSADETQRLARRHGEAVGAGTDPAAVFLLAIGRAVAGGGRAGVIVPRSLVTGTGSARVRAELAESCGVSDLVWVEGAFADAAVEVAVVELGGQGPGWSELVVRAAQVPEIELDEAGTVGDRCQLMAPYRHEYYGLIGQVSEADPDDVRPQLITSGLIDPLRCDWGERPARFGGRVWHRPVVEIVGLDERTRNWVLRQARPGALVASQTPTLEAALDPEGQRVGVTPTIRVTPDDPDDLLALGAVLWGPVASRHVAAVRAGSGRSARTLRVTAASVAAVPWPAQPDRLAEIGAALVSDAEGTAERAAGELLAAYGLAADHPVRRWWHERRAPGRRRSR